MSRLDELGRLVREQVGEPAVAFDVDAVLDGRPRRRAPFLLGGLAVAAAALVVGVIAVNGGEDVVTIVEADDASGFIEAKVTPRRVAFSDGSVVTASSGSRLRVAERTSRGATLTLESGSVDCDIRHRDDTRWSVLAGPVEVKVRGTVFSVRYDPLAEQVDVALVEGRVEVLRAGFAPVVLTPGQRVSIDAGRKRVVIDDPPAPPPEAPPAAPDAAVDPKPTVAPAPRPKPRTFDAGAPVEVSLDELFAQAEAARLGRRFDEAVVAYEAVYRRARATPRGALAAFQLGRLEELRSQPRDARRWYEAAVEGATVFDFRPEALGRLMVLLEQAGETELARERAREYLEVAPSGGWSALARKLAGPGR